VYTDVNLLGFGGGVFSSLWPILHSGGGDTHTCNAPEFWLSQTLWFLVFYIVFILLF
jgi:hypothetical protein